MKMLNLEEYKEKSKRLKSSWTLKALIIAPLPVLIAVTHIFLGGDSASGRAIIIALVIILFFAFNFYSDKHEKKAIELGLTCPVCDDVMVTLSSKPKYPMGVCQTCGSKTVEIPDEMKSGLTMLVERNNFKKGFLGSFGEESAKILLLAIRAFIAVLAAAAALFYLIYKLSPSAYEQLINLLARSAN